MKKGSGNRIRRIRQEHMRQVHMPNMDEHIHRIGRRVEHPGMVDIMPIFIPLPLKLLKIGSKSAEYEEFEFITVKSQYIVPEMKRVIGEDIVPMIPIDGEKLILKELVNVESEGNTYLFNIKYRKIDEDENMFRDGKLRYRSAEVGDEKGKYQIYPFSDNIVGLGWIDIKRELPKEGGSRKKFTNLSHKRCSKIGRKKSVKR